MVEWSMRPATKVGVQATSQETEVEVGVQATSQETEVNVIGDGISKSVVRPDKASKHFGFLFHAMVL